MPEYRSPSEKDFAEHLTALGLYFDYERQWGRHKPDFTITTDQELNNVVAVADVKDFHHTKKDLATLAAGKVLSIKMPPHDISGTGKMELTQLFGANGKMINKSGDPMNTRISAIGLLRAIRPDETRSGFDEKVKELAERYLANGTYGVNRDNYIKACTELRKKLIAQGFKLDEFELHIDYVLNPLAAKPFPKEHLQKRYVTVWEYDISTGIFDHTYDWFEAESIKL